jgi:hypothetical protein
MLAAGAQTSNSKIFAVFVALLEAAASEHTAL